MSARSRVTKPDLLGGETPDFMVLSVCRHSKQLASMLLLAGGLLFVVGSILAGWYFFSKEPRLLFAMAIGLGLLSICCALVGIGLFRPNEKWYAATENELVVLKGDKVKKTPWTAFVSARSVRASAKGSVRLVFKKRKEKKFGPSELHICGVSDPHTIEKICNRHIGRKKK